MRGGRLWCFSDVGELFRSCRFGSLGDAIWKEDFCKVLTCSISIPQPIILLPMYYYETQANVPAFRYQKAPSR